MKVLLLSPYENALAGTIIASGDTYAVSLGSYDMWPKDVDFIVSFGHRKIIKGEPLTVFKNRMINIHVSMLPWNRGADPNFWSWFDDTPKGVSIHFIDQGIDTGPILAQMGISKWKPKETLRTSYDFLQLCAKKLFELEWHNIRAGRYLKIIAKEEGSYHKSAEKDQWMKELPLGWDSPVDDVKRLGERHHG